MKIVTFAYSDVIHLRQDFNENDIFGTSRAEALTPLMEDSNNYRPRNSKSYKE